MARFVSAAFQSGGGGEAEYGRCTQSGSVLAGTIEAVSMLHEAHRGRTTMEQRSHWSPATHAQSVITAVFDGIYRPGRGTVVHGTEEANRMILIRPEYPCTQYSNLLNKAVGSRHSRPRPFISRSVPVVACFCLEFPYLAVLRRVSGDTTHIQKF